MQILYRSFIALIILIVVLLAVAFLLPREVTVARSITINASPEAIFPYVNDLKKMNEWSPWARIDPKTEYEFEGPSSGKGQKVTWSSTHEHMGIGSQEIIESVPNKSVRTALDFGEHGTANATLLLEPDGEGTKVTWGFTTDTGYNPMARYMGLMMDSWVGEKYMEGLQNLKKLVEGQSS